MARTRTSTIRGTCTAPSCPRRRGLGSTGRLCSHAEGSQTTTTSLSRKPVGFRASSCTRVPPTQRSTKVNPARPGRRLATATCSHSRAPPKPGSCSKQQQLKGTVENQPSINIDSIALSHPPEEAFTLRSKSILQTSDESQPIQRACRTSRTWRLKRFLKGTLDLRQRLTGHPDALKIMTWTKSMRGCVEAWPSLIKPSLLTKSCPARCTMRKSIGSTAKTPSPLSTIRLATCDVCFAR